ncbi:ABC transporter family substrate-binding protein [Corynebacterium sp. A21]|uniref:ABC transporter family substrate-binding protein n=1 Tax=Corynebacterium sp. A21 TaxID=3457318 RepID=UPI003FD0C404
MRSRSRLLSITAIALAASLAACSANPGPPPVEETTTAAEPATSTTSTPTSTEQVARSTISIGIDPLRNGLNPHLLSDDSAFVQSLASLVLPSPFHNGELDTNVMVSAEEVAPVGEAVQTLRYVISPEAQWSDGTPITGADFNYLWRSMIVTPGVIDAAAYHSISSIRTSAAGKTVEVDLSRPLASWQGLFAHLLPSHLVQPAGADFAQVLLDNVPASAGRFMVQAVDRSRGMVTLHRNDRFWGSDPALTDVLHFREIRSVASGTDQLRSGQVSFLDITPQQTSVEAYNLMVDNQVRTLETTRELQLSFNTASPSLETASIRAQFASLIDVPVIARLAAGRSSNLGVPDFASPNDDATELRELSADEPLRIAADPADDTASAAVRTLIDMLAQQGVRAELVAAELSEVAETGLPAGDIDAVVTWRNSLGSPVDVASAYQCPPSEESPRTGNLTGYCVSGTDAVLDSFLAGSASPGEITEFVAGLENLEHLTVPLLRETRVQVLGGGIVGVDPLLENWPSGISSAASWRMQ